MTMERAGRSAIPASHCRTQVMAYAHEGYWACMDTFKEKQDLEDLFGRGRHPGQCGMATTEEATSKSISVCRQF